MLSKEIEAVYFLVAVLFVDEGEDAPELGGGCFFTTVGVVFGGDVGGVSVV